VNRLPRSAPRLLVAAAAATLAVVGLAACGSGSSSGGTASGGGSTTAGGSAETGSGVTLRLGYFPNLTHAVAIAGIQKGIYAKDLGSGVTLKTSTFNAGPEAVQALFSGAIDASFVGPNPTINAWAKSKGKAIKVISGAASGGAFLVVKPGITSAADLKGKKIATPQLGNTQDVALRYWLSTQGLKTDTSGGGDVSVVPQDNSQTLQTFKQGAISGAWVPEPYATRMVQSGGKVLVDERSLWPNGQFVSTQLIVRTQYLKDHPDVIRELIEGQVAANEFMAAHPADAQQMVDAGIAKVTGTDVGLATVTAAWGNMTFTNDPIASSLNVSAQHAISLGLLQPVDLKNIDDLTILNQVLAAHSLQAVTGL
jgi:NitT/TauT family transport system substrate-binding protein